VLLLYKLQLGILVKLPLVLHSSLMTMLILVLYLTVFKACVPDLCILLPSYVLCVQACELAMIFQ